MKRAYDLGIDRTLSILARQRMSEESKTASHWRYVLAGIQGSLIAMSQDTRLPKADQDRAQRLAFGVEETREKLAEVMLRSA